MADLREVARSVLVENLAAEADETLLVVTDTERRAIGRALFEAGDDVGMETGLLETRPLARSGMEPPAFVAAAMREADVVVCPTTASLTHTRAREAATEAGARVATMPGITESMFGGGAMTADYGEVERITAAVTERLSAASSARIESSGETLTLSLAGRDGIASDGLLRSPGESGNLPSGEGYLAPVEDTAEGTIVFDGGLVGVGALDDPLVVHVEAGTVSSVEGAYADSFLETTAGDVCARRVAELGLGTNPAAEIIGTVLEDEKVYGSCHVAFGDNHGFGGTIECDSHVDGIVLEPDVYLDDELVLSGGDVVV
ncbi:aminopeptidase [Halomarina salina]|uniref:Aminopeptidase n=1 Tax=Halomarina salina TaxID=1872699 RepID=A0ABD5RRL3_9EURY|nr:aminopeptidase [Halomarina salina]